VRGNDESEEGLRWVSLAIPCIRTSRETSEGGTGGVVACSRMRNVERCDMGVDTSSYAELFAGPWRTSLVNIWRLVACHVTEWKGVYCLSIADRLECVRWETDRRGTIRQSGRVRFVRNVRFNSPSVYSSIVDLQKMAVAEWLQSFNSVRGPMETLRIM